MFSADRILTIRKSRGFSQEMLAEQSGVSLRTIQRVEQGGSVPRGHTLQALATALGVSLDDFRSAPAAEPGLGAEASSLPAGWPEPDGRLTALAVVAPPQDRTMVGAQPLGVAAAPVAEPAMLRSDPQFVQLLNLSALGFLVLPLLNIVLPLLLWRARRHHIEHVAEVGRRVLGFQILWQVASTLTYLLLVLAHWLAARFFQAVLPGTFLGVFVVSYVLNVLAVGYAALQLRRGNLAIYRFGL
ncbi:helix-turn-helix domain-containing protein [Hymenobacter sp. B81]|uniref:helix-turn-helix domain-containing protein n=1 Tax=Hymenobacter sp. B81 TaxID=3344878 RepID=UPI0037DCB1C0